MELFLSISSAAQDEQAALAEADATGPFAQLSVGSLYRESASKQAWPPK